MTEPVTATGIDVARQVGLMTIAAMLYFGVRAVTRTSTALAIAHGNDILARKPLTDHGCGLGLDVRQHQR